MKYDFSNFFKQNSELLDDFIKRHTSYLNISAEEEIPTLKIYYQNIFDAFCNNVENAKIVHLFEEITNYKISIGLPYIVVINELNNFKNILLTKMVEDNNTSAILELLNLFNTINNTIANIYLKEYVKKLLSLNNVRLSSLSDLPQKNIISHYEAHLIWLTNLATCVINASKENFPELESTLCSFGKWLAADAKETIQNNSKYKAINELHTNLHFFGKKIYKNLDSQEYHLLITYLEKCELISLGIGTELALIDNILMNHTITKDSLTNALNRQTLKNVFESQYELSLATDNPFVLAMCDLDNFKSINDTYGHIAGDKMLQLFVDQVKKHLRNSDIIIRYGGEEFVIILPAIKKIKGYDVLDNIRKTFAQSVLDFEKSAISTTVSIGMVEINPEYIYKSDYLNTYLSIADKRLYDAKHNGKDKVILD